MEQKDPHFNINNFVNLSHIDSPEKRHLVETTLQALADDLDVDGQTLQRDTFETIGKRVIITTNDYEGSTYSNGVINIDFKQLENAQYETSPELGKVSYENALTVNRDFEPTFERYTLPEALWHEFEHARDIMPPFEKVAFQNDIMNFKEEFTEIINQSKLPQNTVELFNTLSPLQLSDLLRSKNEDFKNEIGTTFDVIAGIEPKLSPFKDIAILLNYEYFEAPEIKATNENFRIPKGLPPSYQYFNLEAAPSQEPQPILTMEDVNHAKLEASLPLVDLYKGEQCINCEDVDAHDIESPTNTPNNKPISIAELK